jgi:purine-binding chemotaxis protein CheW
MGGPGTIDVIAFKLQGWDFCVETTSIREIRGWGKSTPIPHAPKYVAGVMDLRGTVIPIFDLAVRLGMPAAGTSARSAIVVAEIGANVAGMVVDGVSDLLTVDRSLIQPLHAATLHANMDFARGMITHETGMICFLDLGKLFTAADTQLSAAA